MSDSVEILSFKKALKRAEEAGGKKHILLGNGFSIGAHKHFEYGTLYEQARKTGHLSNQVQGLFDRYGTTNFEEILLRLREARWLAKFYKLARTDKSLSMKKDYQMVKDALVSAIATTHPAHRNQVSDQKLQDCVAFLQRFHNVFTTNYDLLLYWAQLKKKPPIFKDGFWLTDKTMPNYRLFDSVPTSPNSGDRFIYYLHGALHFYAMEGQVGKVVWGGDNSPLIKQIKEALSEDRFPLVVSEGDSKQKKVRIEASSYLSACSLNFRKIKGCLFVFGSSLGKEDAHILKWIAENPNISRLFLGVYGDPNNENNHSKIARVRSQVEPDYGNKSKDRRKVLFYDSNTTYVWGTASQEVD